MTRVLRSLRLALADLLRPRTWAYVVLPILLLGLLVGGVSVLFWDEASSGLLRWLSGWAMVEAVQHHMTRWFGHAAWLGDVGGVLVGLMLAMALYTVALLCAVVVASAVLAPLVARDVARRRFGGLARRGETTFWQSVVWSASALARAMLYLLISLPLWWVPGVHFIVPPLIWGWLNARVMGFDVLSDFATGLELRELLRTRRRDLVLMGVVTGLLGAAPAVVWASGLLFAAFFAVLMPLAAMIYMAVLVFTALWFAHYTLDELQLLRDKNGSTAVFPIQNKSKLANTA
ncbi:hypothetical protein CCO03_04895 [Comamonas serinivorans]|uniref:EI24 domain-containing protein n=1 Tax=Comamonas serinivorans TaxID=1082851 RepID=A0A1Y0EKW7_9BURK|nr:EI24 domain-containing protein [Comamonas serinivorans]ARU04101.1 hypothetical protein CCO03_04895 [Comamonas serinivorans]